MKKEAIIFSSIFILLSCGKDNPFSEKYWEDGRDQRLKSAEEETVESYNVSLNPIIADQTLSGSVNVNINLDKINVQANLMNIPSNIDVVRFSVTTLTCEEIRANGPPAPVSNLTYKDFSFTLNGNKSDFLNLLNQGQISRNNLVIYGLYGSSLPGQANLVFPIACGPLRGLED